MSDEEPDYLSDEFLAQCVPKEDVRPGLLFKRADKRKHELMKQMEDDKRDYRKKTKSIRVIEEERRNEGMKTAIGSENKGFQMLQKMGFKPGMSIGLPRTTLQAGGDSTATTSVRTEPIPIEIKSDRKGLGEKSKIAESRAKIEEWKKVRDQLSDTRGYRNRLIEGSQLREVTADLRKSQTACRNLDMQHSKTAPNRKWFWPEEPKPEKEEDQEEEKLINENEIKLEETEEEEEDSDLEAKEKLDILTEHLRITYFYCIWCGVAYDDANDLENSCPGNNRQDH